MVITKVSLKQKRPQLKKWGSAAVTTSKTFVRASTGPRARRRIASSLRRRSSVDEGSGSKVNSVVWIKCVMELHLIYTYETRRAWKTGGNKRLSYYSLWKNSGMLYALLLSTEFPNCISSSYQKMFKIQIE